MVKRLFPSVIAVVSSVVIMMFSQALPAAAQGTLPTGGSSSSNGSSSGSSTSSSGQTSSGDSGAAHTTRRSCSLYATSSSYGLSCLSGGDGHVRTIGDLFGKGVPATTCWDTYVSPADAQTQYDETIPAGADYNYFLLSCTPGATVSTPLTDLTLSQQLVEINKQAKPCPDPEKTPFTAAQLSGRDTSCILGFIKTQGRIKTTVDAANSASIPNITIVTHPATAVRTQVDTVFTDAANCDGCTQNGTVTEPKSAGGVTLYARLDSFKILPYGPYSDDATNGRDARTCSGTADPAAKDACHYTYTRSSGNQTGHAYPFRAVATWSVMIKGEKAPFAVFHKYDDLKLPVVDVQTLVVGNGRSTGPG